MRTVTVGVLAHVDAGKTTITEQLLCHGGAIRRAGSVDQGTARTDFLPVERERGISVRTSTAVMEYNGVEINLIDTPGHVDFAAEVERSLAALDMAVLVISAVEGIQAQTEILYEALRRCGVAVFFFINKMDRAGSRVSEILEELRGWGPLLLCSEISGEGSRDCQAVPRKWEEPDFAEEALDAVSAFDQEITQAWLEEGTVSAQALEEAFVRGIGNEEISPVFCGSGLLDVGVRGLLDAIAAWGRPVKNRQDGQLSGVVYQITHDKTMGRVAHVRLFGGEIRSRDTVPFFTPGSGKAQEGKISQIRRDSGGRWVDAGFAGPGQTAALCGLAGIRAGDILGEMTQGSGVRLMEPLLKVRVEPAFPGDLEAVLRCFQELEAEDPALRLEYYPQEKELDVCITGAIQQEILAELARERYGLTVGFSQPAVLYRETPAKAGRGFAAYTMPKPCWAIVELAIEPLPPGSGFQFAAQVPNDQIFYRYQNHVREALPRALQQGLWNWPVTDLKITLTGGSHHTVHTHPLDFFVATPMALMNSLENTGTVLLEPIQILRISAQEELAGKIMGDIVNMRGVFDSPVTHGGSFTLEARVPAAESLDYPQRLAALTGGRGVMSVRFAGYEPCPPGKGQPARRHGVDPRDREKWILTQRSAMDGAGASL